MTRPAGVLVAAVLAAGIGEVGMGEERAPARVVFVCEHGNVKSLIAGRWFDRLAAERGLSVRAVSRGLSPESGVPGPIAERLHGDGFDVLDFHPRALQPEDLPPGSQLVMIGADAPAWVGQGSTVVRWDGIPPASERYDESRDALRERIQALLDRIEGRSPPP